MKKLFFIPLFIFLFCGCYNYKELNNLAITSAIGIDKVDDGYKVTAQVVNTQKSGSDSNSSSDPKIVIYERTSKTIQEAVRNIILESPKRLYPNHMQILLIGEDVAKDGIKDTLDLFFRDSELQKNFYVLIAKDYSANKVLKTLTPLDAVVASNIQKSLETDNAFLGVSELITFEELMDSYLNPRIDISLPSITLEGKIKDSDKVENIEQSDSSTKVVLSEMTVFKDDKMLGYLNKQESIDLSFIKGKINNTLIRLKCDDGYIVVETKNIKTSLSSNKNNINIEIKGDASINEASCNIDLENNNTIKSLDKKINKKIENNINETINYVIKNYNSDIFGLKNTIYKSRDTTKYNLNELKINTKVSINIEEKGNIIKVIK